MIIKNIVVGKIEILEDGQIQIRTDTIISEDNIELSRTYHRHVIQPGDDVSKEDLRVISHTNIEWTPGVIKKFKDNQQKLKGI